VSPSAGWGGGVNREAGSVGDGADAVGGVVGGAIVAGRDGAVDGGFVAGGVDGGIVAGGVDGGIVAGGVAAGRVAAFAGAVGREAAVGGGSGLAARRSAGVFGAEGASSTISSDRPTNPTATAAPPNTSSVLSGGPVRVFGRE
jgi:hypothetical protein